MAVERRAGELDDDVAGLRPSWVYEPSTLEAAVEVMRECDAAGAALAFRGGGTQLGLGRPPRRLDALLRTSGLSRIIEYEPADLVVSAEAGLTLAELQRTVGEHGQRLAVDPPSPERVTLGGLVARADFGPRRARYGAVRDSLLGVSLVRSDGAVARSGGKVVKNVAGFDLPKVVCGSLGTLGLIARVTFRLHPVPESTSTLRLNAVSGGEVLDLLRALRHAQLEPSAAVVLWSGGGPMQLALTFEGFGPAVRHQAERLSTLARQAGLDFERLDPAATLALGQRHDAVRACPHLRVRVATLPSRVAELRALLAPLFDVLVEPSLAFYPTLGLGFAGGKPTEAAATTSALEAVRAALVRDGGSLVIEAAPAALLADVDPWGPLPGGFAIMRELKQRFDPAGRLNPGRFVGGL
jgi:glycolate dehydrogenase FAD-binding subunit